MDPMPVAPLLHHYKGDNIDGNASLAGEYVSNEKRGNIHQWIDDIDAIDNITSRTSVLGIELHSVISSEESRYAPTIDGTTAKGSDEGLQLKAAEQDALPSDDEIDLEDDFFVEAALSALEKGKASFDANDYIGASGCLREALTMMKELAMKQQSVGDTWEMRRMLGICAFHVDSPAEAEDALLNILANTPKNAILSEIQRLQVSETAHLLAQVYVKLGNLDKAYRYCEYALRGRRRLLGKLHQDSYESLALMARVLDLQDKSIRAEFFVGMIPEDVRKSFLQKYEGLSVPKDKPSTAIAPTIPATCPAPTHASVAHQHPVIQASNRNIPGDSRMTNGNFLPKFQPSRFSATTSEISEPATVASVSPPASLSPPLTSSPAPTSQPRHQDFAQTENSQASSLFGLERPDHARTSSGSHGLSVGSRPGEPSDTQHQEPSRLPQPSNLQHQAFVSELPGDIYFNPEKPSAQASPDLVMSGHDLFADVHIDRRQDAVPVGSRSLFPNTQYSPSHTLGGRSDPRYGAHPAFASSPSLRGNVHSSTPSQGQAFLPPAHSPPSHSPPPPSDVRSIASSGYSDIASTSFQTSIMDLPASSLGPDAAPAHTNPKPDNRRKTSLLKVFRSSNNSSPTSDPVTRKDSLRYNGVRLTKEDTTSIKSGPLTDAAIDFWQEYLEHEMLQHSPKYVLLRPVRSSLLLLLLRDSEASTNGPNLKAALPDFTSTMHVFIPLKAPRTAHWSLLLVSPHDGLACHYDSLAGRNRSLAEQVAKQIAAFWRGSVSVGVGGDSGDGGEKTLQFVEVSDVPQQLAEKDSGVFVCFFMQYLISKLQVTAASEKVDAGMKCAVEAKSGRRVLLRAVEARGKKGTVREE